MTPSVDRLSSLLQSFRRPEYTGENRCVPCTALNLFVGAVLGAGFAYLLVRGGLGPAQALAIGGGTFALAAGTVYFRGYLVPYTPTITKRYFPDRVLRWFDKAPDGEPDGAFEPVDVEETLTDLGVVTPSEQVGDLVLDGSFRESWRSAIEGLERNGTAEENIAALLDLDDENRVDVREYGDAAVVAVDGHQVGQWESDAAFAADVAADRALREWSDEWNDIDVLNRSRLLGSLRVFVEQCPSCGGPVSMGEETVESCCRTVDVVAVSCLDCGSRIFEMELSDDVEAQL